MNKAFAYARWWDLGPIILGLFVIANLLITTGDWYSWIFPTGVVATAMIASGLWRLFGKKRLN